MFSVLGCDGFGVFSHLGLGPFGVLCLFDVPNDLDERTRTIDAFHFVSTKKKHSESNESSFCRSSAVTGKVLQVQLHGRQLWRMNLYHFVLMWFALLGA